MSISASRLASNLFCSIRKVASHFTFSVVEINFGHVPATLSELVKEICGNNINVWEVNEDGSEYCSKD
jgi:predicted regulator of amino acid metabolism with ACT domain